MTGFTGSSDFPGTGGSPVQSGYGGGEIDAFITKLNAAGTSIVYSTYLGGSGGDVGEAIAVDQVSQVYVTGGTGSSIFPGTTSSLIQSTFGGDGDAFVTKLNEAGTAILFSTYLGGGGADVGRGIALDSTSNVYVTGITQSLNFPGTARSPIQRTNGGGNDAFLAKLNATGTAILLSTYLGGSSNDFGEGIAVDVAGQAYVTGETTSSNFPGTASSPIQNTLRAESNIFVAKITSAPAPTCSAAKAVPAVLWSPNHQLVPIAITGVTDPDGHAVTIKVTGVTQDEPVNAKGDGNTSPDAVIQAGAASVRAERSGKGNGRVYEISFKADDAQGGVCTGSVKVSVPHSLQKGATAIDDGQIYDSTIR